MRIIIAAFCLVVVVNALPRANPDAGLSATELITKYGFTYEEHEVQTEDGYLMTMHRIPTGRLGAPNAGVVFLMHGLTSSSADWVNSGESSLAFLLADLGYDVWLGNSRGNKFGRKHVSLDPDVDKSEFWNFSWDEIGRIDLPTMIDYTLATTEADGVYYAGHSQGTTSFFVMTSEKPEYNAKIKLAQMLAPVAFMNNLFNPIAQSLAPMHEQLESFFRTNDIWELPAANKSEQCAVGSPLFPYCKSVIGMLCGFDEKQLDDEHISVIMTNLPAGAAMNNFLHYAQGVVSAEFKRWDYHSAEANVAVYGQAVPPSYDVSKITAKVALHYGQNDWLAAVQDVQRLRDLLPNVVKDNMIAYEKFNHADFLFAKDVVTLLYNDVIELIQNN